MGKSVGAIRSLEEALAPLLDGFLLTAQGATDFGLPLAPSFALLLSAAFLRDGDALASVRAGLPDRALPNAVNRGDEACVDFTTLLWSSAGEAARADCDESVVANGAAEGAMGLAAATTASFLFGSASGVVGFAVEEVISAAGRLEASSCASLRGESADGCAVESAGAGILGSVKLRLAWDAGAPFVGAGLRDVEAELGCGRAAASAGRV